MIIEDIMNNRENNLIFEAFIENQRKSEQDIWLTIVERLQRMEADQQAQKDSGRGDYYFRASIEPGKGATYDSGRPTLYAYTAPKHSSILSGRTERWNVTSFESTEEVNGFIEFAKTKGIDVDVIGGSEYAEDEMLDLPDEDGSVDPDYVSPNDMEIQKAIHPKGIK
jgi:hypothetical protein